jgi:penicillin-binding protein 1A
MTAWLRIPLQLVSLGLAALVAATAVVAGAYFYVEPSLPAAAELRDVRFQTPMSVYSRDGRLMTQFGEQLRTPAEFDEIPLLLKQAIIAAEDDRFYEHDGIDLISTIRAFVNYGIQFVTRSSDRVPGGSTITQQITRTTDLLSRDYAVGRKVSEIFLAFRIEREFTKDEILGLYLNTYFFGQRSYGVVTAARTYFNKEPSQLSLAEAAVIAGIPTAPSRNNPFTSPENAAVRRAYVLRRMHELGYIDRVEREAALKEPILSQKFDVDIELSAGYVAAMAYDWCQQRFGKETCDISGIRITTTIDSRLQRAANQALRDGLMTYDRNHGYRGPIGRVDFEALGLFGEPEDGEEQAGNPATVLDTLLADYPDQYGTETAIVLAVNDAYAEVYFGNRGVVSVGFDAVSWAREFVGDYSQGSAPEVVGDVLEPGHIVRFERLGDGSLQLAQIPEIQGAIVSVDPLDGAVAALTGGFSYQQTAFNRASQALRQPGSAFKPFFYLSALANGYTLATVVNDAPLRDCSSALEECHTVVNYEGVYHGELPLREALHESLNAAADRVIRDVGARYVADHIERFGFEPLPEDRNASLALGSMAVTPLALANAYAVLANGGYAVGIRPDPESAPAPYFVQRVEDAQGNVLYDASLSVEYVCAEPEDATEVAAYGESTPELIERRSDLYPPLRCAERVESPQLIYLITDVLKSVIQSGSGARAGRAFPARSDLAGKTGTTNGPRDAWFAGFNADIVAVARVGFDDDTRELGRTRLGSEQGGRTAIPVWIDYMTVALDGMPGRSLPRPPGIVERRVNRETGLVAAGCNRDAQLEFFVFDNVPEREPDTACFSGQPLSTAPDQGPSQSLFE